MESLLLTPTELFAVHLYVAWPLVVSVVIQTPEPLLFGTTTPFWNNVKVSTTGFASSIVQVKFATVPAQTLWLIDRFVIKVTLPGASELDKNESSNEAIWFLWKAAL